MEKIIFFGLAVPILGFVFYLGGTAIMKGFKAKVENRPEKPEEKQTIDQQPSGDNLSNEITKLNELLQSGVLTQEEFEKAKKKLVVIKFKSNFFSICLISQFLKILASFLLKQFFFPLFLILGVGSLFAFIIIQK